MDITFLEDGRTGSLSWATLHRVVAAAEHACALPEDARHVLKERLKSEVLPLVLNSLTVGTEAAARGSRRAHRSRGTLQVSTLHGSWRS